MAGFFLRKGVLAGAVEAIKANAAILPAVKANKERRRIMVMTGLAVVPL